jgi:hypothetical protein
LALMVGIFGRQWRPAQAACCSNVHLNNAGRRGCHVPCTTPRVAVSAGFLIGSRQLIFALCQSEASCHLAYAARTSHRVTKAASGLHFIGQHVQRHLIGHFSSTVSFGSAASHPRLDGPEQVLHGLAAHAVEPVTSFEAAACLNEKGAYPKYKEYEAKQYCTEGRFAQ